MAQLQAIKTLRFGANVNGFLPSDYVQKVCVIFRSAYVQVCFLETFPPSPHLFPSSYTYPQVL